MEPSFLSEELEDIKGKIFDFIYSKSDMIEENFTNLIKSVNDYHISTSQEEMLILLYLLVNISNNYYRSSNFFQKIEQILLELKFNIITNFSNFEIFNIFKSNKRILLFLISEQFIFIDKSISFEIINISKTYQQYFYPEVAKFMNEDQTLNKKTILSKLPENFFINRLIGENESYIAQLIREDAIDDFIQYITKSNTSLKSKIGPSIYETNSFFIENIPDFIEYSAFFGSYKIFKYLQHKVNITDSIWPYAIHGKNLDIINILKEIIDDSDKYCFIENDDFSDPFILNLNELDKSVKMTKSMKTVIENIKNFSCTHKNLIRQAQLHFSNKICIFLYECLKILISVMFRTKIIIELIEVLLGGNEIYPYLFNSLYLIKNEYGTVNFVGITNFIELLMMRNLINSEYYDNIIDTFFTFSVNDNCKNYLKTPSSKPKNTINARQKLFEMRQNFFESIDNEPKSHDDEKKVMKTNMIKFNDIRTEMTTLDIGFRGNRYTNKLKDFALLLLYSSRVSFNIISQVFALPCERTLITYSNPIVDDINKSIFDIDCLEKVLEIQNCKPLKSIDCNCAIDAAVFNPIKGSSIKKNFPFLQDIEDDDLYNSIITYYIEPIEPHLPCFPIHVEIQQNGFFNEMIDSIKSEIIKRLQKLNIECIFSSTDGDKYYDPLHDAVFSEYKDLLERGEPFENIVLVVHEHNADNPWPLSDPFHSLKNVRVNVLFTEIGVSLLEKFDPNELADFVKSMNCLSDDSSNGSMKDSYPLQLFGFDAFIDSKDNIQCHFLICPFYLYLESIRNCKLNKETRKKYLQTAFIFMNYFIHQLGFIKTVGTRISIIRIMNTILGIYACTERDAFNLANLGTHPLEFFYGNIRIHCYYDHTIFNVINSISKTIISNHIIKDFDLERNIKGRKNIAGAIVEPGKCGEYGYFPFSPDEFFNIFLKKLYGLQIDPSVNEKLENWYEFLIENYDPSNDCEYYIQGKISGCNIMSRNISGTEKKSDRLEKIKQKKKKVI